MIELETKKTIEEDIPNGYHTFENVLKAFWTKFDEIYQTNLTDEKIQNYVFRNSKE